MNYILEVKVSKDYKENLMFLNMSLPEIFKLIEIFEEHCNNGVDFEITHDGN